VDALLVARTVLDMLHLAHSRPTFYEHKRVGGTLARVCGRSLIRFIIVGAVRKTALRTPSCIDFVRLHRTYTRYISCEWSH
jgi:hypothetical protein